jgi:uncharacterized membrane protein SirB2
MVPRGRAGDPEEFSMILAASTGAWLATALFVVIWIALAFWPARVAGRKGHSFAGYFILSLFFFPLAIVMAYVVKDRAGDYVRS